MRFSDVIGQQELKVHLADMVQQNRLSHALLFLGKEGCGGLPLAMAFAQYIVCERRNPKVGVAAGASLFDFDEPSPGLRQAQPDSGGPSLLGFDEPAERLRQAQPDNLQVQPYTSPLMDACGECPPCQKAQQLVHPDIHFSYPVIPRKSGDKPKATDYINEWREFALQSPYGNVYDWLQSINAENRQGNITAEECNDIIRKLSLKSFESEYKILVMWMPEYLGKEGNKLLKLIEEPPPNTLFILVAESEEQILPTILSRTQLVKIPLLDNADVEAALKQRNGTPPEQAKQVAAMVQGNYREALQLLQHSEEDWLSLLTRWMTVTAGKQLPEQLKLIGEIAELGREKQKQFLRYFNHLLEQCVRLRMLGEEHSALSDAERDFAQRMNKITGIPQQHAIIEETDRATYYIERNANGKMLFHALTIKLYHIIKNRVVMKVT